MNDSLKALIKTYEEPLDFTHPSFSDESIAHAESELGVTLSEEYVSFLREFGHGGINGVETIEDRGRFLVFDAGSMFFRSLICFVTF